MRPELPAKGRNGRWVQIGDVGVDSATLAITDPAYVESPYRSHLAGLNDRYGSGVQFLAGFGDGSYAVWAWMADYGENGETDERIAQVIVTLIDDNDLQQWRSGDG